MLDFPHVVIGIGSNLADRGANVRSAYCALQLVENVVSSGLSSMVESDPADGASGGPYYNAAALLVVSKRKSAREWVTLLLHIEAALGRTRPYRYAPRTIDLDLLWMNDEISDEESACVPHPRLESRAFALIPLVEVAPWAQAPGGQKYAELAKTLRNSKVRIFSSETL